MEKKVCAFELRPVLIDKIYLIIIEVFWRENILLHADDFLPSKVKYIFYLMLDAVQIRRFFFLSATLHTQKKVKEIAYILTSYQALLKAQLFFFIICLLNKREGRDNMMEMSFYLFLLLIFFLVIQLFVTDK